MVRLTTCVCALTVGTLCILGSCFAIFLQDGASSAMSTKPPAKSAYRTDVLTVFLTGNELGALQPCGCSGGQLGGLDRRSAVFNSVPASERLIVDAGSFVEGDSEQDSGSTYLDDGRVENLVKRYPDGTKKQREKAYGCKRYQQKRIYYPWLFIVH